MKKFICSAMLLASLVGGLKAQQDPSYSMYMFNGLFINPAYAGSMEVLDVMAIYRAQWVGLEGAPNTANISINSPFRQEQYAMGMVISDDKLGLSNTFNVTPSFSYRLRLNQMKLCFGVQATLADYYMNNNGAHEATIGYDPAYPGNQSIFVPNFGFGIYGYGKRYFFGISAPHLLPDQLRDKTGVVPNTDIAKMYNAYVATGGYVFGKDPAIIKFRPTVLIKWQQGLPKGIPQIDISPALLFIDRFWLGVTYRTGGDDSYVGQAIIIFAQFKVTPQLSIGYSYDAELTALRHFTSGSQEVMLSYDFWYDKKRFVTPRYVKYF